MSNMSYCKFRNTLQDLKDCRDDMKAESAEEKKARKQLLELCQELIEEYADGTDWDSIDDQEDDD